MKTANQLRELLQSIDHKSYPAYKAAKGSYAFSQYTLNIEHVQGDPFASPSKLSLTMDGKTAGFPARLYDQKHTRIALQDYLTRLFYQSIQARLPKSSGSGKSGLILVSRCGQEILERTACSIASPSGDITLRFEVGFPARGRTIDARELITILYQLLPECTAQTLLYAKHDQKKVQAVMELATDQHYLRQELKRRDLIAFVANGAILPRESGICARPLKQAVPFRSPESFLTSMELPYAGQISGMGLPRGITLIVGGGYHGKSTLLQALELGIYNHVRGDGREYVITDDTAVKIRSEDGRSIKKVDISMFINNLPNAKDTVNFYSEDASGSTSQAANVIEALESGSSVLLFDEDTCATNFMVRDDLMQRVVHPDQEPISPFIEKANSLYEQSGISSVIVAGSSGSYFHIADYIIQMNQYLPTDITAIAKQKALSFSAPARSLAGAPCYQRSPRSQKPGKEERTKLKTLGMEGFQINHETVTLHDVEQIADIEQITALSYLTNYFNQQVLNGNDSLQVIISRLYTKLDTEGLAAIISKETVPPHLAMPRIQELYACINRYRGLKL